MKQWPKLSAAIVAFALVGVMRRELYAAEPMRIPLWENGSPGVPATKTDDAPVMFLHRPATGTANGTAVVICPGGGYGHLAMDHEGAEIASWLNSLGVTAFVLKYRHNASGHKHPVPMQDGQQHDSHRARRVRPSGELIRRGLACSVFPPADIWQVPWRRISTPAILTRVIRSTTPARGLTFSFCATRSSR